MVVIRSILTYLWVGVMMIIGLPVLHHCNKIKEKDPKVGAEKLHRFVQKFCSVILKLSGIRIVAKGKENIPAEEPVVFIGNHQSMMDVAVMLHEVDRPLGFLAKAELSKIGLVRKWILGIGSVFIERGEIRKGLEAIIQSAKVVKSGHALAVYPEGTRTRDGSMGEFKAGSMKIASKGGACIVPVAIRGAFEVMPPNKIWFYKGTIEVDFLPPISAEEVKALDSTTTAENVKAMIQAVL